MRGLQLSLDRVQSFLYTGIKEYFFYSWFFPLPVKYEPVKKSKFLCAESNANEQNLLLLTCTQGL